MFVDTQILTTSIAEPTVNRQFVVVQNYYGVCVWSLRHSTFVTALYVTGLRVIYFRTLTGLYKLQNLKIVGGDKKVITNCEEFRKMQHEIIFRETYQTSKSSDNPL